MPERNTAWAHHERLQHRPATIGFSYDLLGNGKTVLRGGFGMFFERMQGNDIYNVATAAPFSNTPGLSNTTFDNPFASWAGQPQSSSRVSFELNL
jgi:hypothetical protein